MIGYLSASERNRILAELEHGAVLHKRVMALEGASQELVRALRDLVVSAGSWEELFEQSQRYILAAKEGHQSLKQDVEDVFRLSYDSDERSVLQTAVREYIVKQSTITRYAPSGGEEAFVTVRVNARENLETAERLLGRL